MKTVQPSPPDLKPRPGKVMPVFKGDGWWPIEEACQFFDMRPAQLRGLIARNQLGDPLGRLVTVDGKTFDAVYPFSVERYLNGRK